MITPNPADDGVHNINVWTNGKTRLGRLLTHLSDLSVDDPRYGRFSCGEGLYYYIKTGCVHEELRTMSGYEAKRYGQTLPRGRWVTDFWGEIKIANRARIDQHPELRDLVEESTLPFEHYYVYQNKVVVPRGSAQYCKMLEEIRADIFNGR